MIDITARGYTLPEAYHAALVMLNENGAIVGCEDYGTRCKEVAMTMHVICPTAEPRISRCIPCGPEMLMEYELEMIDGIKDWAVKLGLSPYTYHDRMRRYYHYGILDQIQFVIEELKRNPNSRRAVIDVRNNNEDMYSDDPACLQHVQFLVRGGKLDCSVLFRSNDAVRATFMNAFALIRLQEHIADALGVGVGTYTHRANSFHAYENTWDLLDSYCERIDSWKNLTYSYAADWKEQMDDAVPAILRKVEEMKR